MSVKYDIHDVKDPHWVALIRRVNWTKGTVEPEEQGLFYDTIHELLLPFNGILIVNDRPYLGKWIEGIEFDTDASLIMFKLTYN